MSTENISKDSLRKVFQFVSKDKISKDAISQVLKEIGKGSTVEKAIDQLGIQKMERNQISEIVSEVLEEKEDLIEDRGMKAIDALMGIVMKKVSGQADGETVHEILEEKVNEKISQD